MTSAPSRLPARKTIEDIVSSAVGQEKRCTALVLGMIAADPQERLVVGYGSINAGNPAIPDGNTVFEIGSITKVFTGSLLGMAVKAGEMQLSDPIDRYLPAGVTAPNYAGVPITLLDLATHTSGLPSLPDNFAPQDWKNPYADYTPQQMYAFLSDYQLTRQPAAQYDYSNLGMGLLGNLLVNRAGAADYETLLRCRICDPLGMHDTRVRLTPEMRSRLTDPHNNLLEPDHNWDLPTLAGAGAIRSTVNDLLTFLAANMGMAAPDMQAAFTLANTPQRPAVSGLSVGLGWHFLPTDGEDIHWHNGQTGGYTGFMAWKPDGKMGVVILSDAAILLDDIGFHLLHSKYSIIPHVPRTFPAPLTVDAGVLAGYAGVYSVKPSMRVTIRVEGGRIFMQSTHEPEYELHAISAERFYIREDEIEVSFTSDSPPRLMLHQAGGITEAAKTG